MFIFNDILAEMCCTTKLECVAYWRNDASVMSVCTLKLIVQLLPQF